MDKSQDKSHPRFRSGHQAELRNRVVELLQGAPNHTMSLAEIIDATSHTVNPEDAMHFCRSNTKVWDSLTNLPEGMWPTQAVRLLIRASITNLTESKRVETWGHHADPHLRMVRWTGLNKGQRAAICATCGKSPLQTDDRMRKTVAFDRPPPPNAPPNARNRRGKREIVESTLMCSSCGTNEMEQYKSKGGNRNGK